ncbi:hypothetical protein WJX84_010769 [Apatococcus fuscideae]|uniref:R3H domain-containing protein n=1 Tax=Apatococcus fuscideae TaxID=2026836 RepID=A0AAW1TFD7_9CHLO
MPGGKSYNRGRKQGQKKIKPVPAPADDALSVQLLTPGATTPPAEIGGTGLVLGPDTEVTPASESGCLHCVLESWSRISDVIAWFCKQMELEEFHQTSLRFSSKLGKDHRAYIHSVADHLGKDVIRSESHGVGDERLIALVSATAEPPQKWLDPSQDHKAKWLYIWAKEAGLVASRDELAEMLARDALTPPLAELWTVRTREQKAVGCLCQAAAAGDLPALQAACEASPEVLRGAQLDVLTGAGPLHAAAEAGQAEAASTLLHAGVPADCLDGHGHTALQVSRKFEQSDVEGVLLRAGATDLRVNEWLPKQPDI